MELLNKEILTLEELELVEESQEVTNVEDCGMSGNKVGYHWYNVTLVDGGEHSIYTEG